MVVRRTIRRTLIGVAAVMVGCAALAVGGTAAPRSHGGVDACPTARTLVHEEESIEAVIAGARARMPKAFRTVNYSQGSRVPVTAKTSKIYEVFALNIRTKQAARLRGYAVKKCGRAVASESWVVVVVFPGSQTAFNQYAAFLAKSTTGWRLYQTILEFV